jgi:hypothetical protein
VSDDEFKEMRDRVRRQILANYERLRREPTQGAETNGDFVARYYQYHRLYEMPCKDVEEAIFFLAAGVDHGHLTPGDVTRRDGTVTLGRTETLKRIETTLEEWHAESAD